MYWHLSGFVLALYQWVMKEMETLTSPSKSLLWTRCQMPDLLSDSFLNCTFIAIKYLYLKFCRKKIVQLITRVICVLGKQWCKITQSLEQLNLHSDGERKKEGSKVILQIMMDDLKKTNGFHKKKKKTTRHLHLGLLGNASLRLWCLRTGEGTGTGHQRCLVCVKVLGPEKVWFVK